LQGRRRRKFRVVTFVAVGLSGLLPVVHACFVFAFRDLTQRVGVGYCLAEGVMLLLGTGSYAVSEQ
jgi:adiponectin receptor